MNKAVMRFEVGQDVTKVTCSNRLLNNHLICTLRTTLSFPTTNSHLEGRRRGRGRGNVKMLPFKF